MANKAAFSTDEWNQVLGGAFIAGFAVTAADPSGLWGLFKETFASGRAVMEAKSNATASELSIAPSFSSSPPATTEASPSASRRATSALRAVALRKWSSVSRAAYPS